MKEDAYGYQLGFWHWCKDKHPKIILEYYKEMEQGVRELEEWAEDYERTNKT
jgi:hypothetical protein